MMNWDRLFEEFAMGLAVLRSHCWLSMHLQVPDKVVWDRKGRRLLSPQCQLPCLPELLICVEWAVCLSLVGDST